MGAPPLPPEQIPSAAGLGHRFPAGGVMGTDGGRAERLWSRCVSCGYREIRTTATWAGGKRCPSSRGLARTRPAQVQTRRPAVSLLRRVGPTVRPTLMKQTDEGLRGDKHCSVEQQETRAESPSSDSTEVTASSRSRNPCFGGSCHGFPKRSATKASTCLMLFSGQLRFSVK